MNRKSLLFILLMMLQFSASAQQYVIFVIDKKAIAKSSENLAMNVIKQQAYKKILEFSEDILGSYTNIEALQRKVLEDLKQAESVQDLHWTDLSKSLYLANELVKGVVQPDLEIEYVIEHPLFQESTDKIYQDLFIAGAADPLPEDLISFHGAKQRSQSISNSFHQVAVHRKAYAAVAFQYLAEDFILKSTEMNEMLKQPARFSMTEAERMRLQTFSEEYLLLAGQLLTRSDQLLEDITYVQPLRQKADHMYHRLERSAAAQTPLFNY